MRKELDALRQQVALLQKKCELSEGQSERQEAQCKALTERAELLDQHNNLLTTENRLLRQKLDHLARRLFGVKSEKLDPAQLELLLLNAEGEGLGKSEASAALPPEAKPSEPTRPKRKASRPRIPEHLPVTEEVLIPEPVKACPEAWRYIGEEISEQLDYEPGRFLRRRTVRKKYVKRSDPEAAPIIAPLPERLVERGLMSPGLMAHVVVSKYADHLPLYRQEQMFRSRHDVHLPRQTLCRAVDQVADWLRPIVADMIAGQFAGSYVQIDETPVKYPEPGAGKAPQGYLWTSHVPGGDTVYHWHRGRGHECLKQIVPKGFSGTIQCDGYAAYGAFAKGREDVALAGCWAHARRNFKDALEANDSPQRAGWILRQISHLYRIEKLLRHSRAGPALREAIRQSQSRPLVERIHRALSTFKLSAVHLPQSTMGKAINYALGQWPGLVVWLGDGQLEIDNNQVENAIRPTAVGKKNWLFIGAETAGWRSAVIYSVVTSCRNRGVDPYAYLKDVLERLPTMTNHQIPQVTPKAWAEARLQRTLKVS